ncbi:MAG: hypothetical protein NTZ80_03120, partial [Patescibacteria group bacterium]|nr:hypothetical protein [Patescibacteria group bacterium]
AWEISYGLNPYYASDTNNDPDNDSRTNLEEYQDNTNPRIPEYGSDSTCASNASPLNITEPKIFYNDDKIILTWADSSDSDVTHVQIFRSVGAGAPAYQNPINVLHGTQRYEDEGIIKDEIYAYSFQTLDSCGKNSSIWENAVRITTNDDQIAPPPEDGSITITLKLATTKENEKRFVDKIKGIFEKMAQGVSQVTRDILASAADMFNPNEQSESEQGEPAEPISTSTGSAITENAAGSGSQVNTDNTDIGTGTGEQAAQPQGKLSSIVQKQLQAKRDEVAINATENIALVYLTNDEYTRALETAEIAEKGSSAQMSAELVKARQDLVAKTSEQDRLESDIQYFTNLINTTQQEIEVLQLQEANAAGENTYEREILQSKKEEVDSQITLAMNEKATTEDTINNMTTEKNDLQNQRQSIDAEIVNTKAQKQEIENGSGDEPLIDKIAQLERNIARAISEINYKQSDINGINSSIEKLSKGDMSPEAISQIMQTMDGQRLEITAYKNQKIEKDAQKKQLEVSLAAANVQLQDLSEKYFMATNAKNKIAQDIANYGQTINYKDQAQLLDAINQKLIEAVDSSKTATDNDLVNLSKVQEAGDLKQVLEKYNDAIIAASDKEILTLKEKVEYALKNKYQFSALQPYMTWEESVASCGQTGFRLPTSDEIKWAVNNDAIQLPKEDWQSYAYHRLWTSDIISKPPTGNMNPDLPAISWRGAAAIYSGDLSLFGLKSKGIVWAFPATEQTCTVTYTGFFREKTIECEPNQYETACLYEGNIGDLKIKEWQEYNAKIIKLSEIVIQEIENNNLKPENFPALLQRLDVLKNIIAYTSDNSNYNLQGLRDKIADFEQNPPYQSAKVGFLELTEERDQAIQNENLVSYYVEQAKNKNAVEKSLAQNLSHLRKIYDNNAEVIALFSNTGSSVVLSQMQETNDELTEKYDISNINADSSLAFPDELRKEFVADSINKIIEYTNLQNAADDKEREAQEAGNKMKEAETVSQLVKTNLTQAVNSISEIDRQIILLEGSLLTNQYKLEISQVGIIRLDKLTQELNKIEQEYQDLIVRKSDMETELTDLKDELISTNSALGEVIGKLDSLEKQKQQIINSISEQTIAITAQKELLKNVSRRLKEFDQRKKDVDEQLLALDRGENIRTRIQNKETAIYEYQINIARTQSGITALNDVIANLENSIENNLRNQEQYQIGIVEKAVMDKISQFVDMHIAEDLLRQNLSAIASQLNGTDLSTTNEILAQTDLVKALDNIANIKEILRGHSIQGTADFYRSGSVDIVRSADVATNIYGIATVALPGLQPGKYDIVIHASRITPRRIKDIDIQFGENTIDATNEYLSFGDLNGDEKINRDDLDYAIHHWDAAGADLNEDGEINLRDLLYIYKNWGAE